MPAQPIAEQDHSLHLGVSNGEYVHLYLPIVIGEQSIRTVCHGDQHLTIEASRLKMARVVLGAKYDSSERHSERNGSRYGRLS